MTVKTRRKFRIFISLRDINQRNRKCFSIIRVSILDDMHCIVRDERALNNKFKNNRAHRRRPKKKKNCRYINSAMLRN